MSYTTIQITPAVRDRLSSLKSASNLTYDELLVNLLNLLPSEDEEGEYSDEFKASLIRGLSDIKHGRTYSHKEVKNLLGVE